LCSLKHVQNVILSLQINKITLFFEEFFLYIFIEKGLMIKIEAEKLIVSKMFSEEKRIV